MRRWFRDAGVTALVCAVLLVYTAGDAQASALKDPGAEVDATEVSLNPKDVYCLLYPETQDAETQGMCPAAPHGTASKTVSTDGVHVVSDWLLHLAQGQKTTCRLQPIFLEAVGLTQPDEALLALLRLDRRQNALEPWLAAEVLSVLVYLPSMSKDVHLWLRAGPDGDTGWVSLGEAVQSLDRDSPLRGCRADLQLNTDPRPLFSSADEPGAYFLQLNNPPDLEQSEPEEDSETPSEPEPKEGPRATFRLAWKQTEVAPLTRSGVAQWLIEHQATLNLFDVLDEPKDSLSRRREILRRLRHPLPASAQTVPTGSVWLDPVPLPQRAERWLEVPELPGTIPSGLLSWNVTPTTPSPGDNASGKFQLALADPEVDPNRGPRVWAVQTLAEGSGGFNWKWAPVRHAEVGGGRTDGEGFVVPKVEGDFDVLLKNSRWSFQDFLSCTHIECPHMTKAEMVGKTPSVFMTLGAGQDPTLAAANAFVWLEDGYEEMKTFYPWLPQYMDHLVVSQHLNPEGDCRAYHTDKALFLPFYCPRTLAFVPKAYCGDVVLHEAVHELTDSLVSLATLDRYNGLSDSPINEGMADFFAIGLRNHIARRIAPHSIPEWERYGMSCPGDAKDLTASDPGHGNQNAIVRAMVSKIAEKPPQKSERFKTLARLASLSAFYGFRDTQHFFVTLIDFAKHRLGQPDLGKEICLALNHFTGVCYDGCNGCVQVDYASVVRGRGINAQRDFLEVFGKADDRCRIVLTEPTQRGTLLSYPIEPLRPCAEESPRGLPIAPCSLGVATIPENLRNKALLSVQCGLLRHEALPLDLPPESLDTRRPVQRVVGRTVDDEKRWVQWTSQSGHLLALPPETSLLLGNGLPEGLVVATEPDLEEPLAIWPDVSVRDGFEVEGWTREGRQFQAEFQSAASNWSVVIGDEGTLPMPRPLPELGAGTPIPTAQDLAGHRIEVIDLRPDAMQIAQWWTEKPTIEDLPWPDAVEVLPDSVQVGFSPQGTVFSVQQVFPPGLRHVVIARAAGGVDGPLTLIDADVPWVARTDDGPSVTLEENGPEGLQRKVRLTFEESLCKAPPYLHFDADGADGTLLAMTCDGVVVSVDLATVFSAPRDEQRQWTAYAPGVVVPDPNLNPIQRVAPVGGSSGMWILGPFRRVEDDGRHVDRLIVLNDEGKRIRQNPEIVTQLPSSGGPRILQRWDNKRWDNGCVRLALAAGSSIDTWNACPSEPEEP